MGGYSVKPFLMETNDLSEHIEMVKDERPNYVTSQYHSSDANTGVFMVRKDEWKYLQYGHYLDAFQNYSAQLFNLTADPGDINNVIGKYEDVASEMENILMSLY